MRKFSRVSSICFPQISSLLTLDDILDKYIGKFGKFQKLLTLYILLFVAPLIGFNTTTHFLILLEPPHLCTKQNKSSSLFNFTDGSKNSSLKYNGSELLSLKQDYSSKRDFNYDIIYPTVVSENDWVCENSWKAKIAHVVYRAGSFCGMLIIGILSDTYGRVPTTIFCFSIAGIAGLSTIVSAHNYALFLICRAFMGFVSFKGTVPMVLATEYVGSNKRSLISNGLLLMIGVTNISLPWIAYFLRDWRILTVMTSAAMFIVPMITLLIPESARWLLSRGDFKNGKKSLRHVARINGVSLSDDILNNLKSDDKTVCSVLKIFKYSRFLRFYSITTLMWILCAMISYGGNLFAAVLSSHPFLLLSINSAIDVIASITSKWVADHYGRKKTVCFSCFFTLISYTLIAFVPQESIFFIVILLIGRFWITITYNVKFLYAAEICPTIVRSRAVSTRLALGAIGSAASAAIVSIDLIGKSTPLIIFGTASGFNIILMLLLPETLNQPLPETLEDANNFGLLAENKIFKEEPNC
ncbi:solute carrier family 22 member 6-like protein, partial [Dinothrombium tinctorium]